MTTPKLDNNIFGITIRFQFEHSYRVFLRWSAVRSCACPGIKPGIKKRTHKDCSLWVFSFCGCVRCQRV